MDRVDGWVVDEWIGREEGCRGEVADGWMERRTHGWVDGWTEAGRGDDLTKGQ